MTELDPLADLLKLMDAFKTGHVFLGVALATGILVWALRKGGKHLPGKVGKFFGSKVGGWALAFASGVGVALTAAAVSGAPFTFGVLLAGLSAGIVAAGGWEGVKDAIDGIQHLRGVEPVPLVMVPPTEGAKSFGDQPSAMDVKNVDALFTALGYTKQADGTFKREQ